jgi:RND family efflux transporter MFP subunit
VIAPRLPVPFGFAAALVLAALVGGCGGDDQAQKGPVRPVRTVTVVAPEAAPAKTFPGRIEAADTVSLGFRIPGRVSERLAGVGASVKDGQLLARLDPETELNELRSARAALAAAEGVLRQAEGRQERQSHLHQRGVTSTADLEAAEQGLKAARAQVEAAAAQVRIAEDVVGFTELRADAAGVVTAVGAEPGEVVQAGRMIVRLAREGGRDAVFDVPADVLDAFGPDERVSVEAAADPAVRASGRVREVSPQADPVTRLFRIRVGLADPPEGLKLGMSVQGSFAPAAAQGFSLPASALVRGGPEPAVWVVDTLKETVSLRPVKVDRDDPATVIVAKGLSPGEVVVTAGVNGFSPGQKVRLAGVEP